MRIHSILDHSQVNGPGNRFVVWVQGCSIHCDGCANKHMWDPNGGEEMSIEDILFRVPDGTDGISVTGGEPLDQPEILEFLKAAWGKEDVFVTTGYTMEQVKAKCPEVLKYIDILVTGPFDKTKIDKTTAWRGSTNQVIHFLSPSSKAWIDYQPEYSAEIILKEDGNGVVTGFHVPDFLKEDS